MSWLGRAFLVFVMALIGLSSCKRPDSFGSEVQPDGSQLGLKMLDTFSVTTSTVLLDSFNTGYPARLMLGQYKDPMTGSINAECYTQVRPPREGFYFYNGATYDSLVLILMPTYFYGDTTSPFSMDVYKLTQALDTSMRFSNQKEITRESSPIGTATFIPGKKEIHIPLSNALGQELFNKGITGVIDPDYATYAAFNNYFKGLALVPKDGNKCVMGLGTVFSVTDSAGQFMRLYSHDANNFTYNYNFALNSANVRYNKFSHDFSGTPLASLQKQGDSISSELTNNQCYIQGAASLMTKLSFPGLQNFRNNFPTIAIIKAELYLKAVDATLYTPPLYLNLYQSNNKNRIVVENGLAKYIKEVDVNGTYYKSYSFIDSSDLSYRMTITSYIQEVMYGKIPKPALLLGCGTEALSAVNSANNVSSVNRMSFSDNKAIMDRLRLRIYYQPLK